MILSVLGNLGRDVTVAYTQGGKAVANLALAYTVGFGQNEKTVWLDCVLWGDRAVSLQPHLVKGTKLVVYATDLELETYQKNDGGQGSKLKCRVINIEFAGGKPEGQDKPQSKPPQQQQNQRPPQQQQQAPAQQQYQQAVQNQAQQQQQQGQPQQGQPAGFNDFED